jgi:hypothetical protein
MILAAFLVALLAAPPFAGAQEDTKEQMSQAVTAKKQVQEQVQLAKERAQESSEGSLNAQAWSAIASAGERTAQKFAYASQLFSQVVALRENDQVSQANTVAQKAEQMLEQAQASRETFSQALASIRQENFNQAIATAEGIQSVPEPEEMVAGGPGEAPAEEVAAGGPGAVVPPVPDFAPAEVDAPSGVGSTE